MNVDAQSRLAQWWVHGVDAVDRARPVLARHATRAIELGATRDELSAALATRIVRWVHRGLQRLSKRDELQTPQGLLALARRVEGEMPDLAAELRTIAKHRPAAPE